jgi:CBS domain-containing protein
MKKREPIRNIMTPHPIVLFLNDGLEKAEILFKEHKMRHLPVVQGEKIVGIISMTDLARISFVDSYDPNDFSLDTSVYELLALEQIMVCNPKCIHPNDTVKDAAEHFLSAEYHALPVVENDKLVGIVTTTDLLKYLLDQY